MRHACQIQCLVRAHDGEITHYAGSDGEGQPWKLSRAELIRAIQKGDMTCYVTFEGHAHLVVVQADALTTYLGILETLLPHCR